MTVWFEIMHLAVEVILISLLALDIVEGRRRRLDARLEHIEQFLRFAKRPP